MVKSNPSAGGLHVFLGLTMWLNTFVTRPGDLRDSGRAFRYEARRSPGLIA